MTEDCVNVDPPGRSIQSIKCEVIQNTFSKLGEKPMLEILKEEMEIRRVELGPSWKVNFDEILEELEGVGPLKPLLEDQSVSEILTNSFEDIYFEKSGYLLRSEAHFSSPFSYDRFIKRMLTKIDKVADRRHPIVDGTLEDGTRIHIVLPPVTKNPALSIRRHIYSHFSLQDLADRNFLSPETQNKLRKVLGDRLNILICGPTGAGKTTLLRALIQEVSPEERIISVEDTEEIRMPANRGIGLLTRIVPEHLVPPVTLSDLLKQSLRMRPDRIIVGEIRGEEALVFLDAISTGHKGSMSSIHSSSPRQALTRLESLVSRGAPQWPIGIIRQMIYEGIDLVICVGKKQGCRLITEISEIAGIESFGLLLNHWKLNQDS